MGVLFNTEDSTGIVLETDDLLELKERVFTLYGWPNVKVEITDDQFNRIIKRAVSYLNTYSPKIDYIFKQVMQNYSDYTIIEYNKVHSVLDVYASVEYLMGLGMPFQTLMAPAMAIGSTYNSQLLSDYVSLFTAYDMAKRMFGLQPIADLIQPNIIRISPIPYIDTRFCFVITVDHDSNLASLNDYEVNWFTRFMEAATGKVIGETRRKYDGLSLPVGSLSTSGSSMYSENAEKEKELIEEIKGRHKFPQAYIAIG